MRNFWLFACAVFAAALHHPAHGAEALVYAAPPAWVQSVPVPAGKSSDEDSSVRALLQDSQVYFAPDADHYYYQSAYQVLTTDGLDELGLVTQSWDPLLDTLTIHAVEIIRDGKVIDALKEGEPFSVIRREQNLNYAMLDGQLTATKQLEDLRIGDIVRVSMTITSKDPSLADHAELWDTLNHEGVIAQARYRYIWPKDRELRWRSTTGFSKVDVSQTSLGTELLADGRDVRMPIAPLDAPDRFNTLGEIEITSFKSWRELSALFAPYYAQASTLKADSPVRAEVTKIREAHSDKISQASAALALVEERVRYLALTMGQAGYQPAQADLTWSRRFGDCKGKSALLVALLRELGIDAEPAIVRTHNNDGLDKRFPRAGLFDHVIVRAEMDGRIYWLDATRTGDADIRTLEIPPYLWALPLRAGGAELTALIVPRPTQPMIEITLELDQTAGLTADNPVVRTEIYRGEMAAIALRKLAATSKVETERTLREGWAKSLPWFKIEQVKLGAELAKDGSLTHVIVGKATTPWAMGAGGRRTVSIGDSTFKGAFAKREEGSTPIDAPYSVSYPYFTRSTVVLKLPRQGEGFDVVGADVDRTVAGMAIRRSSGIKDGVFKTAIEVETLDSEISFKEGSGAEDDFGRLPTARPVMVRAPVNFASTSKEIESVVEQRPKDAQALILRAQNNFASYRPTAALADVTEALALSPGLPAALRLKVHLVVQTEGLDAALPVVDEIAVAKDGRYAAHQFRSYLYQMYERWDEALVEADKAVELSPTSAPALSGRAAIHREMGNDDLARADIDAAVKLEPNTKSLQRLKIRYATARNAPLQPWRDQTLAYLDEFIAAKRANSSHHIERAGVLASSGRYDQARRDYDKAISLDPTADHYLERANFLAGRQEDKAALADYDRAVALEPTSDNYQERASFHASRRDFARARRDIEAAMKLEADDPGLIMQLANLEVKAGDAPAAFARIEALSRQDPASFELTQLKASIHRTGKAYDLALAEIGALQARKANTPAQTRQLLVTRSTILSDKGDHAAAIAILDDLIAKEPHRAYLLNQRCWARATAKIDLPRAKGDCDAAIAMTSPADAAPYLDSLGLVYLQLGRDAEAVQAYDVTLARRGRTPTSLYGRGLAKGRLKDRAGSQVDIAAATKLDPDIATEFLGYQLSP